MQSTNSTQEEVFTFYQHFLDLLKKKHIESASGAIYHALRKARELDRPHLQAALLLELGLFYLDEKGNLQNAAHAFATGINILNNADFSAELRGVLGQLSGSEESYMYSGDSLADIYSPETQKDLLAAEKDSLLAVKLLANNGVCLLELGQDSIALDVFKGALSLPSLEQDQGLKAKVLTNTAEVHRRLGEYQMAEPLFKQAKKIFDENEGQLDAKEFYAAYAYFRYGQDELEEAIRLFENAVNLYKEAEDDKGYSRTLARLANLHLSRREFGKARPHLEAALELGEKTEDQSNLVFAYEGLARCYMGEHEPRKALPYLEKCVQTLALIEGVIQSEQAKISRIASMQWALDTLIDNYLEWMKSEKRPEKIEEAILEKIDQLHGLILDKVFKGIVNPSQKKEKTGPLERLDIEPEPFLARKTGVADYLKPEGRAIGHPRREKIPPLIRVVYHLTEHHLIIACSQPGKKPAIIDDARPRASIREEVERLIHSLKVENRFRGELRKAGFTQPEDEGADSRVLLKGLYQLLIQPLEGLLPEKDSIVVIEPHDALHMVPFGALISGQEEYFCDKYAILVSPSQETMDVLRSYQPYQSGLPSAKALIVGNPEMKEQIVVNGNTYTGFSTLPGAEEEANVIQRLFSKENVTYLTGPKAKKKAIRKAVRDSNIVHFATHGMAYEDNPMASCLVVAGKRGYISARNIRKWKMPADLVVLSACQTALGRLAETEGVIGLSRSFFLAGARTVVVSLWSVYDEATALLMEYFYKALFEEKTVPEAMRAAQLKLRKQYKEPVFWAGFVVVGAEGGKL